MSRPIIAYIDGANLHKGIATLGWKLDYGRFRSWMRQKYGVTDVKLFIGFIPTSADLYKQRQQQGYACVFKEVVYDSAGRAKGNCDADLVLNAMRDHYENTPSNVVLVSSDGDYSCLIRFWQEKGVSCTVLSPSLIKKCSWLIRKTNVPLVCLNDVRQKIAKCQTKKPRYGLVRTRASFMVNELKIVYKHTSVKSKLSTPYDPLSPRKI